VNDKSHAFSLLAYLHFIKDITSYQGNSFPMARVQAAASSLSEEEVRWGLHRVVKSHCMDLHVVSSHFCSTEKV
jgi:hypothetical protein